MSNKIKMDVYVYSGVTFLIAQGCCWYFVFEKCGCIDSSSPRTYQNMEPRLPPPAPKESRNPFKNPNVPKDEHLQSAYD